MAQGNGEEQVGAEGEENQLLAQTETEGELTLLEDGADRRGADRRGADRRGADRRAEREVQ